MTITTPLIAGTVFPQGIRPISNITPFTYRDGLTYLKVLEELIAYVNTQLVNELNVDLQQIVADLNTSIEEMENQIVANELEYAQLLDQYMTDMQTLVDSINNRVGNEQIQRVTVDTDYVVELDPTWPNAHPIGWQVTQDATGGHAVTFEAPIINPDGVVIDTTPDAMTEFWITPQPDGSWVVSSTPQAIDAVSESLTTALDAETAARVAADDAEASTRAQAIADEATARADADSAETAARIAADDALSDDVTLVDEKRSRLIRANVFLRTTSGRPVVTAHIKNDGHGNMVDHFSHELVTPGDPTQGEWEIPTLGSLVNRGGGNSIITNCQAMLSGTGGLRGLCIIEGVIYSGWETGTGPYGVEAMALHSDGTWGLYKKSSGITPSQMVANGVIEAFSFGPIILENNVVRDISNGFSPFSEEVSARPLIGFNDDHDLIMCWVSGKTGDTGMAGNTMGTYLRSNGATNGIVLDGGGSTQFYANNQYLLASSDRGGFRVRRDFIVIKDANVDISGGGTQWTPLAIQSGYENQFADEPPAVRIVDEHYEFRGRIKPVTPPFGWSENVAIAKLPLYCPFPTQVREGLSVGQNAMAIARIRIGTDGFIYATTASQPTAGGGGFFTQPDYVDLGNLTGMHL